MAQLAQPQKQHWKDAAIERSEVITDAWEVTKIYTGRAAEWILFCCMVANIIGILPGITLPLLVTNIVMGVQVITLDIAGFGLATMAENARANGAKKAAIQAKATAYMLIGIMMLTLVLFTLGIMVPTLKPVTNIAENVLILVRVGMIVFYGHVIHSLRSVATVPAQTQVETLTAQFTQQMDALTTTFNQQVESLTQELAQSEQGIQQRIYESSTELISTLQQHITTELASVYERLHSTHEMLAQVPALQTRLQEIEGVGREERHHMQMTLERHLQEMKSDISELQKRGERSLLRVLPSVQQKSNNAKTLHVKEAPLDASQAVLEQKWDARAFVFQCLHTNEGYKLSEIQQLAHAQQQELALSSISRYRDQYRKQEVANSDRVLTDKTASSEMETANSDEETESLQEEEIA